jgi:hypothetical protein
MDVCTPVFYLSYTGEEKQVGYLFQDREKYTRSLKRPQRKAISGPKSSKKVVMALVRRELL